MKKKTSTKSKAANGNNAPVSRRIFRLSEREFYQIGLLIFRLRNEAKREPRAAKIENWGWRIQKILDAAAEKSFG